MAICDFLAQAFSFLALAFHTERLNWFQWCRFPILFFQFSYLNPGFGKLM